MQSNNRRAAGCLSAPPPLCVQCRRLHLEAPDSILLSGDRCKVNFEVLRRYKEAPILEPLSLPKMPVCFPLNFPLSFPLTAFSEFYGILRASLESLENTTLFRRAFTPFYTPSLIQVPPRAPTPQILRNLRRFSIFKGMCGLENSDISSSNSEYPKQMIYLCRFRAIIPEDNK